MFKDVLKKAGRYTALFLAGAAAAVCAVLGYKAGKNDTGKRCSERRRLNDEEIDNNADDAGLDAADRIAAVPAAALCDGYGSVCDAIAEGKERFEKRRRRCMQETDSGGGDE